MATGTGRKKATTSNEIEYDSSTHLARSKRATQVTDNCMVLQSADFLPSSQAPESPLPRNARESDDKPEAVVVMEGQSDVRYIPRSHPRAVEGNARCDIIRMDPHGEPLSPSSPNARWGTLLSKTSTLRPYVADTMSHTLTMTGTIRRGAAKADNEVMHVQLELSEAEVKKLNKFHEEDEEQPSQKERCCSLHSGPHVLILSFLCFPLAFLVSTSFAFYVGTMFWYNVHILLTEEKTIWHKIFLSPFWVILYPVIVGVSAICIGIYAAAIQLSWHFVKWRREFCNFEKGFYGWLSNAWHIPQCSPYEVVILDEEHLAQDNLDGDFHPAGNSAQGHYDEQGHSSALIVDLSAASGEASRHHSASVLPSESDT